MKPEDANYSVDVLTRCMVRKEKLGKKTVKIVPIKELGEPIVVSVPISQVTSEAGMYFFTIVASFLLFFSTYIPTSLPNTIR